MTNHLNDARLWVLNALADTGMAISVLHPAEVDFHFSFSHGLEFDPLVGLLFDLIMSGHIEAEQTDREPNSYVPADRKDLARFVESVDRDLCISITDKGGALWEELLQPNWDDYIAQDFEADDWYSVSATNRTLIDEYLAIDDVQEEIIPGTLTWGMVNPWCPKYWKTIPCEAFQVRFQIRGYGMYRPKPCPSWPRNPFRA